MPQLESTPHAQNEAAAGFTYSPFCGVKRLLPQWRKPGEQVIPFHPRCARLNHTAEEVVMQTTTRTNATSTATLSEIDEALWWSANARDRCQHWRRWVDALLDERNRIEREQP